MADFTLAEYIWLDGAIPTRETRSKARVVNVGDNPSVEDFPKWSFDGSSTGQATGDDSDCLLNPVYFVTDPIRGEGNFLVMCEVLNPDGTAHQSNSRAQLMDVLGAGGEALETWCGFEQEYTLMRADGTPFAWPEDGSDPAPQGPYYCGVGTGKIMGRQIAEEHAKLCMEAGMMYYGLNAEVMPGQWEFQIGWRGDTSETALAADMSDEMWIARWLLQRISEEYGAIVSFENKPMKGDWNGAGMHTNVSTLQTRDKVKGPAAMKAATDALGEKHAVHVALYGSGNDERLTGAHETCDINTFKVGNADRGCSIRIPAPVAKKGYGYFEDRRPGANADPYLVSARIIATLAGVDESIFTFTSWPRQSAPKLAVAAE